MFIYFSTLGGQQKSIFDIPMADLFGRFVQHPCQVLVTQFFLYSKAASFVEGNLEVEEVAVRPEGEAQQLILTGLLTGKADCSVCSVGRTWPSLVVIYLVVIASSLVPVHHPM